MMEEWRPILGADGSEVSSLGRVRSITREIIFTRGGAEIKRVQLGRIRKLQMHPTGYWQVTLSRPGKNVLPQFVHALVAAAFIGPRPAGLEVCHNDGSRTNNRPGNLRYDTRSGNFADKLRHGTQPLGETHHNAKLTVAGVIWARESRGKIALGEIARVLGVSRSAVHLAQARKNWAHVP